MSNFPLPSDDRLEQMIRDSFEHAPGPDMRRLNQIEARLARTATGVRPRRKLNTLPWWLVLLLAGGFATAAWWVGDIKIFDRAQDWQTEIQQVQESVPVSGDSAGTELDRPGEQEVPSQTEQDRDTPIIYLREAP